MKNVTLPEVLASLRGRIEKAFRLSTSAQEYSGLTPSAGHCEVVAITVHELLGGELVSALVNGQSHWFNRLNNDVGERIDVDLTGDQFRYPKLRIANAGNLYPNTRVRARNELTNETLRRAFIFAQRAGLLDAVQSIGVELEKRVCQIQRSRHCLGAIKKTNDLLL